MSGVEKNLHAVVSAHTQKEVISNEPSQHPLASPQQPQPQQNPPTSKEISRRIHVKLHTTNYAASRSQHHSPKHSHDILPSMQFLQAQQSLFIQQQSQLKPSLNTVQQQQQHQLSNQMNSHQSISLHNSFHSTPHQSPPPRCHFLNVQFDPPPQKKQMRHSIEDSQFQQQLQLPFQQLKRGITSKKPPNSDKFLSASLHYVASGNVNGNGNNDAKKNLIVSNIAGHPVMNPSFMPTPQNHNIATRGSQPEQQQQPQQLILIAGQATPALGTSQTTATTTATSTINQEYRSISQLSKRTPDGQVVNTILYPNQLSAQQQQQKVRLSNHFGSRRASTSLSQRRTHQQHLQNLSLQQQQYLDDFIPVLQCVEGQDVATPAIVSFQRLIKRPFSQQSCKSSLSSSSSSSSTANQLQLQEQNHARQADKKSKRFLLNNVVTSVEDQLEILKQQNINSSMGNGSSTTAAGANMSFYSGEQRRKKSLGNANDFLRTKQLKNPTLLIYEQQHQQQQSRISSADTLAYAQHQFSLRQMQQQQMKFAATSSSSFASSNNNSTTKTHQENGMSQTYLNSLPNENCKSIEVNQSQLSMVNSPAQYSSIEEAQENQQYTQLQHITQELSLMKQQQQQQQQQLRVGIPLKSHEMVSADSSPIGRRHNGMVSSSVLEYSSTPNSAGTTPTGSFHNRNILKKHHLVRNIQDIEQFKKQKRQQMYQFVYESPTKQQRAAATAAAKAAATTVAGTTQTSFHNSNANVIRSPQLNSALRCIEVFNI